MTNVAEPPTAGVGRLDLVKGLTEDDLHVIGII